MGLSIASRKSDGAPGEISTTRSMIFQRGPSNATAEFTASLSQSDRLEVRRMYRGHSVESVVCWPTTKDSVQLLHIATIKAHRLYYTHCFFHTNVSSFCPIVCLYHRRRRRGAGGTCLPPPPKKKKIQEKYFSGKNHVKFGHFVNFSCTYSRAKVD